MMFIKKRLLVGIITNNPEMLRISVPRLCRFCFKFILVIHNTNPKRTIKKSFIRKLGWHGTLNIINSDKDIDAVASTVAIIDLAEKKYPHLKWMTFVGDGDVLLNTEIPNVSENAFAVIQNATTISGNVAEFLGINKKWINGTNCGITGPHLDLNGTWIRFKHLCNFRDFLRPLLPQASKILKKLKHRFSMSAILWQGINTFIHETNPGYSALYMNKTNYVSVRLGTDLANAAALTAQKTANIQFNELFRYGVAQNMVAPEQ